MIADCADLLLLMAYRNVVEKVSSGKKVTLQLSIALVSKFTLSLGISKGVLGSGRLDP
jgi:hypothetical protein